VGCFKHLKIGIAGLRDFNEAIITVGGVSVKEVDPGTMESKLIKNLYIAGEMLDVDALTGGYNIQIAVSTGWLAGNAVE
ncbi:MAG: NAD(P)/FAD-dependent oxidoreductase, partial [Acetobacterium sp.]|nr:NAD(P)/FAD-dependent oxidoreductase [Acetobacterium sp.]